MSHRSLFAFAIVLGLAATEIAGPAQAFAAPPGAPSTKDIHRRLRILRAWEITRALKLDAEKAGKVLALFSDYDAQRSALYKELRAARRKLRRLSRMPNLGDEEVQQIVDTAVGTKLKLAKLRHEEFQKVRALLSPRQQSSYLLAQRRYKRKVRQMLRAVRRRRKRKRR